MERPLHPASCLCIGMWRHVTVPEGYKPPEGMSESFLSCATSLKHTPHCRIVNALELPKEITIYKPTFLIHWSDNDQKNHWCSAGFSIVSTLHHISYIFTCFTPSMIYCSLALQNICGTWRTCQLGKPECWGKSLTPVSAGPVVPLADLGGETWWSLTVDGLRGCPVQYFLGSSGSSSEEAKRVCKKDFFRQESSRIRLF